MRYRPASLSDLETVLSCWVALAEEQLAFGSRIDPAENRPAMRERLGRRIVDGGVLLAEEDDDVVGFVCVRRVDDARPRSTTLGFVEYLYVEGSRRGDGIGAALLESGEQRLLEQDVTDIELDVFAANEEAIDFYEHAGYELSRYRMRKELER